jgi:hypothetical protein
MPYLLDITRSPNHDQADFVNTLLTSKRPSEANPGTEMAAAIPRKTTDASLIA